MQSVSHRVLIIGGGFAGLTAARRLSRDRSIEITLVDRRNFHLFQPLLYQVATGGLSPANIAAPLRRVLANRRNVRVLLGDALQFDPAARRVQLADGAALPYDTLIVATGARHNYFGHPDWEPLAPGLKTIEDATDIRRRILLAFERAERAAASAEVAAHMTFIVVGGGPTGVELAGALAELARDTLRRDFRAIDPRRARIILVDAADRVLPALAPELSTRAAAALERLGILVRTGATVTHVTPDSVQIRCGDLVETIPARTVLWAAGVQASPLGKALAAATGARLDRVGRVHVEERLSLPGHPEIFVLGDLALCHDPQGRPLPGIAPVAIQQGEYVARLIRARRSGGDLPAFRYVDRGAMATIGRAAAVADVRGARFSGLLAWLLWLFVHLMFIVEFQNRVLVMLQWAWNYFTWARSARLITGEHEPPR